MCEPNDFLLNLRVLTFWFDRESITPGFFLCLLLVYADW